MKNFQLILGSGSPRRKEILELAGIRFKVMKSEVEEVFPKHLSKEEIPQYLSKLKADDLRGKLSENQILLTADTLVFCENEVLGKPKDRNEAIAFLKKLSGKSHEVIGAYCLTSKAHQVCFTDTTKVFFKKLGEAEILYYVDTHKPYDKAGAYAIQEWIGLIGITKIEGSYFNVVGLAMDKVYAQLNAFPN